MKIENQTTAMLMEELFSFWQEQNSIFSTEQLRPSEDLPELRNLLSIKWCAVSPSSFSSDGSPVQLSVDSVHPCDLRLIIDATSILVDNESILDDLIEYLPAQPANLLCRLSTEIGKDIPYLGVGFRVMDNNKHWKIYLASMNRTQIESWISILQQVGIFPSSLSPKAYQLCFTVSKAALLQGFSLDIAVDEIVAISFFYRSFVPLIPNFVKQVLDVVNSTGDLEKVLVLAESMQIAPGEGMNCYGYTIVVTPTGDLHCLKVDWGRIPDKLPEPGAVDRVEAKTGWDLSAGRALRNTIGTVCDLKIMPEPESFSWRWRACGQTSPVVYYTLPLLDWPWTSLRT